MCAAPEFDLSAERGPAPRGRRAGLRAPAAERAGRRQAPAAGDRRRRPAPARLGQRLLPLPLHAGLLAARPVSAGGARPAGLAPEPGRDGTAGGPRELFEYWGHEASLLPVELQPLLRWRMARADALAWKGVARVAAEQPRAARVRARAWCASAGRSAPRSWRPKGRRREPGEMWNWSEEKTALEYLFFAGAGVRRAAGQLRAPLRPARAGAAARRCSRRRRRRRTRRSGS